MFSLFNPLGDVCDLIWFLEWVSPLVFDYFVSLTRLTVIAGTTSFFNMLCEQIISLALVMAAR